MRYAWFFSWHGAPTDTKLLLIARRAGTIPGIVSAIMWALLDYASQNDDRGSVDGFDTETYAEFSGFDEVTIKAVIDALSYRNMILRGKRFVNWEKRNPSTTSTPRVRAYRERQRRDAETSDETDETLHAVSETTETDETNETHIREDIRREDIIAPPARRKRTPDPVFDAVAALCKLDVAVKTNASYIAKAAHELRAAGYTEEQVAAFGSWWISDDWRRQNTPIPTINQLLTKIAQSVAQPAPQVPPAQARPDPPAQRKLRELRAARGATDEA